MKRIIKKFFKRNNDLVDNLKLYEVYPEDFINNDHENESDEFDTLSPQEIVALRSKIITDFDVATKRINQLHKQYYMLKLFSRAVDKNKNFNEKLLSLDKEVNFTKRLLEEIKRKMDIVKYLDDVDQTELMEIKGKLNNLFSQLQITLEEATEIERIYYNNIKMASAGIIINKNYIELETFHKNVNEFIHEFKSLQEAAEFVYFHSGQLIVDTVNSLVKSIENSKNQDYVNSYSYNFFLDSDLVLTLTLTEWIELFNKFRYVLRVVNDINIINYVEFKQNYSKLEVRYFVLMLYMESSSKEEQSSIKSFNI